jgi:hypothetical protein
MLPNITVVEKGASPTLPDYHATMADEATATDKPPTVSD